MEPDLLTRFWNDLLGRIGGPMSLRFFLQPLTAMILATRDGIHDAREGRSPYFWDLFAQSGEPAGHLLREGLRAVGRVLTLAVVLDLIYQVVQFKTVHPLEIVVVALTLAFVPYMLLRGPINRLAQLWMRYRRPAAH